MNRKLARILDNITPFLVLGIAVTMGIVFFVIFFYVLIAGVLLGALFWLINAVISRFRTSEEKVQRTIRIIEHNDDSH